MEISKRIMLFMLLSGWIREFFTEHKIEIAGNLPKAKLISTFLVTE